MGQDLSRPDGNSPAEKVSARSALLAALVCAAVAAAVVSGTELARAAFLAAAALLAGVLLAARVLAGRARHDRELREATWSALISNDLSLAVITDCSGTIRALNPSATDRLGDKTGATLDALLSARYPTAGGAFAALRAHALHRGHAREDIAIRTGFLRVTVQGAGDDALLWRIEEVRDRPDARVADGVNLPMLTVSANGTVLYMNDAARRVVGGRVSRLDQIIRDLPLRPGEIHEITGLSGGLKARVIQLEASTARREIYLVPGTGVPPDLAVFDTLPVAVLGLTPSGAITFCNRQARGLLRLEPGSPTSFPDLVTGLGRPVADWVADVAEGRAPARPEIVRLAGEAGERYVQISLAPDPAGTEPALFAVLHDATELKTLEAQFVQSQKMQAIGQLAGGIAHDFNNLLTAISGHCDLLLLDRPTGDAAYPDLDQIRRNADRAAGLVSQLLAFSRKQNLKPELIDMRSALGELAHLLNRLVGERVDLRLDHAEDLKMVRADRRQIEQVVMNLVVNSRDAMPDGGRIDVRTRMQRLDRPMKRGRVDLPAGEYVVVEVTDQGAGIPEDQLQKIFEPFFTTKRPGDGTGLGLSTAYGIIKQTGGYIFAESAIGSGTTFLVYLPAHERVEPEAAFRDTVPEEPDAPTGSGAVLLVEDEAPVRAFAARALQLRGYSVVEAQCAEEALDRLREPGLEIDVFVTDVIMPGMDGPTWVSQALRDRPGTRVVFVSGYSEESLERSRTRIPNSVFLPKPFSLNDLTRMVQAQMAAGREVDRLPAE